MFDEQFIGGSDIFGLCEKYRGCMVLPNNLLNMTGKFDWVKRKKLPNTDQLIDMFTEKSQDQAENVEKLVDSNEESKKSNTKGGRQSKKKDKNSGNNSKQSSVPV